MKTIRLIETFVGLFQRTAWTGGDVPPSNWERTNQIGAQLFTFFLEEQIAECGGLDFWLCAGTTAEERLDIFKNRARLDAWRTFENPVMA